MLREERMKKISVLCVIAAGWGLMASHGALASNRPGAITITPMAGYYYFSSKRQLDNTGDLGLALAYNFTQQWAMEGTYTSMNAKLQGTYSHTHGNLYLIDGLYRFTPHGMFEPYVSAGIGALGLSQSRSDANSGMNVNAGIGTQVFFDKVVALRGEVKDLYFMAGGKNDVAINFGVSFLIDTVKA
jgi:OOP family OmpA-OmpF porin